VTKNGEKIQKRTRNKAKNQKTQEKTKGLACILSAKVPFLQKTHTIPVLLKRRKSLFHSEEN
jgi:hypothetical protein